MLTIIGQRDPKWAAFKLGNSPCTIGRYGCTTCCLSMVLSWFNKYKTPSELAVLLDYTNEGYLIWGSLKQKTSIHLENRFVGQRDDLIKEALTNDKKCVILQVDNYHWVWALGKSWLGGYRIADPWFGDIASTRRYKKITGGAVLTLN